MNKLWAIAREEMMVHLRRVSFYVTTLLMAGVFVSAGLWPQLRQTTALEPLGDLLGTALRSDGSVAKPIGFVDLAGLVDDVPADLAYFVAYPTRQAAAAALQAETIDGYYVIAKDYLDTGAVAFYRADPQLLTVSDGDLQALLRHNLREQLPDQRVGRRLAEPFVIEWQDEPPPTIRYLPADLDMTTLTTAALVVGLFTYIINTSGFLLLGALQRESQARVLEVLITSSTAGQFIGGKILGLSLVSFLQIGVSLIAGLFVYGRDLGASALPIGSLLLTLPYLLLGYLSYSGVMLSVATLVPNLGQSMQLQLLVRLVVLSPLAGVLFILPNADGWLAVVLTLVPLTSFVLMPFRLLIGSVAGWQIALSLLLLLGWAGLLLQGSVQLFRAHTLLTGRPLTFQNMRQLLIR